MILFPEIQFQLAKLDFFSMQIHKYGVLFTVSNENISFVNSDLVSENSNFVHGLMFVDGIRL